MLKERVPRIIICMHQHMYKVQLKLYMNELWHAVAHLVEKLRYKPEGRGLDSRWCHWKFLLT